MTPPPGKMSKLFGALGADESAFDARVKAAANDAKQRWPMFKSLPPESSELPPLLSDTEKDRRAEVAPDSVAPARTALSRPGLSAQLSKGLSKIARQTSAEVRGSAKRAAPLQPEAPVTEPLPPLRVAQRASMAFAAPVEPAPNLFVAPPSPSEVGLFAKALASAPVAAPTPPEALADDSLDAIFQRLEGTRSGTVFGEEKPLARVAGVMSRLGRR
jgi:hypothetical protein